MAEESSCNAADVASAYKDLVSAEQYATKLESLLNSLESKIDDLLESDTDGIKSLGKVEEINRLTTEMENFKVKMEKDLESGIALEKKINRQADEKHEDTEMQDKIKDSSELTTPSKDS